MRPGCGAPSSAFRAVPKDPLVSSSTLIPAALECGPTALAVKYQRLCSTIQADLLPILTAANFVCFDDQSSTGRRLEGGLIIKDDAGLVMVAADQGLEEEVDDILHDLIHLHQAD